MKHEELGQCMCIPLQRNRLCPLHGDGFGRIEMRPATPDKLLWPKRIFWLIGFPFRLSLVALVLIFAPLFVPFQIEDMWKWAGEILRGESGL